MTMQTLHLAFSPEQKRCSQETEKTTVIKTRCSFKAKHCKRCQCLDSLYQNKRMFCALFNKNYKITSDDNLWHQRTTAEQCNNYLCLKKLSNMLN